MCVRAYVGSQDFVAAMEERAVNIEFSPTYENFNDLCKGTEPILAELFIDSIDKREETKGDADLMSGIEAACNSDLEYPALFKELTNDCDLLPTLPWSAEDGFVSPQLRECIYPLIKQAEEDRRKQYHHDPFPVKAWSRHA
eukprot:TRINITY_DN10100_c0_g1_i1.p1 TRINITY_DN10100_c0_g1~~TRINITY_DN10100_c0_g1_i1.p1  ORF type:complete len:141 (-),score=32.98 TRINITY_DN10100_c0_g1_i1:71-493(-)